MEIVGIKTCANQAIIKIGIGIEKGDFFIAFGQKAGLNKTRNILLFTFCNNKIMMSSNTDFILSNIILSKSISKYVTDNLNCSLINAYENNIKKWGKDDMQVDSLFRDMIMFLSAKIKNRFKGKYTLKSNRYDLTLEVANTSVTL